MCTKQFYLSPCCRTVPCALEENFLNSVNGDGPEAWVYDAEEGVWE